MIIAIILTVIFAVSIIAYELLTYFEEKKFKES